MKRAAFVAAASAFGTLAIMGRADATGGIDVFDSAVAQPQIRVLLGSSRGIPALPIDGRFFSFDGRRYRGKAGMVTLAGGRDAVVATLPLDDYLYGVVPLEAPPGWPRAMLSAQAIVARTYALTRRRAGREYDVTASDADQHYGGVEAETYNSNLAVDASSGELVTYAGGTASVVYSASCGGHTADAALVWGHGPVPYLRGVPCTYCRAAPDYRWTKTIPFETLAAALGARTASIGEFTRMTLEGFDASGRPATVAIDGDRGGTSLSTVDFRRLIGASTIKSTLIRSVAVDRGTRTMTIAGAGNGHGAGLCQWGARGLALAGASAVKIIEYYYPGTTIALASA